VSTFPNKRADIVTSAANKNGELQVKLSSASAREPLNILKNKKLLLFRITGRVH
jgi:hypothetical protein